VTLAATGLSSTAAQLNGTINPNGATTSYRFEWGLTNALGNSTSTKALFPGDVPVAVLAPLSGLAQNTTYYFRVRASSADNANAQYGAIRSFTTPLSPSGAWRLAHLGDADADLLADHDGDGISTLAEYGLNLPPEIPNAVPHSVIRFNYPDGERLRLRLEWDSTHDDVTVEVQAGGSIVGPWTTIATSTLGAPFSGPGFVGATPGPSPGVQTVEIRDIVNLPAASQRFMRVRVTE
jgi:hypothetical protein